MRGYRKTHGERVRKTAFKAGVDELRKQLIRGFRLIGNGELSGWTAVEIVRNTKIDVPRGTSDESNVTDA
jgi:hypothetical protein